MIQQKEQCTLLSTVKHNAATVLWAKNDFERCNEGRVKQCSRDRQRRHLSCSQIWSLLFFLHVVMQSRSGDISNIQDYFNYVDEKIFQPI